MINTNLSGIFRQNRFGGNEEYNEDPSMSYEEQQQRVMNEDGLLRALQPVNFNQRIMGGENFSNFMYGKMSELDGSYNYAQRVNILTGKGVNTMDNELNVKNKLNNLLGGTSPLDKVNMMTGLGMKSDDKISIMLGQNNKNHNDKMFMMLGQNKTNGIDKINKILNTNKNNNSRNKLDLFSSKNNNMKDFFNVKNNNIKVFEGLKPGKPFNVSNYFNTNNTKNVKENALNKINSSFGFMKNNLNQDNNIKQLFGTFGNPEKTANKRLKQQKGLSLFGDNDGDKLMNVFDCDPLDYLKQGEQHNLNDYMNTSNEGVLVGKPYIPNSSVVVREPTNLLSENQEELEEPKDYIYPEEMDTSNADIKMGNFRNYNEAYDSNFTGSIGDFNKDGVEDEQDNEEFFSSGRDAQIKYLQDQISMADNEQVRKTFINALNTVYKTSESDELYKTKRADEKLKFDRDKWEYEKAQEKAKKESASKTAEEKISFDKIKWATEQKTDAEKRQFAEAQSIAKFKEEQTTSNINRLLGLSQFQEQQLKSDRDYKLQVAKLKAEERKGENIAWENKLKAGSNLFGSLLGPGESMRGFQNVVSTVGKTESSGAGISKMTSGVGGNVQGMALMSGAQTGYGSPQNMMLMSGGLQQSEPFGSKVTTSVGTQQTEKPWSQRVKESLTTQKPEELLKEEALRRQQLEEARAQEPVRVMPTQKPQQYIQQPQYAPRPQQYIQQPQYAPRPQINWDNVSPQQVAQYDPQYAKYLAESHGETTYRRGPYKKY
jgi:hypothetical protein